jgi:hypothetical protein
VILVMGLLATTAVHAVEPRSLPTMVVGAAVVPTCQIDVALILSSNGARACSTKAGHLGVQPQPTIVITRDAAGSATSIFLEF